MSVFNDRLPVRPGSRDFSQFFALARFLAPYRLRIAGAVAALLVAAVCVLALGQGLRYVIDAGFAAASPAVLDRALAAVVGLATLLSVATFARLPRSSGWRRCFR